MSEQQQGTIGTKSCPTCGGTWPSDRRNCLACGANLETVPARPVGEKQGPESLSWAWLDAMADEAPASEVPEVGEKEKPGCLARIFPGLG